MADAVGAAVLRAVLEHARAQRAALIVVREGELQVEALASTSVEGIDVDVRRRPLDAAMLPERVIQLAAVTRERVVLDDASAPDPATGKSRVIGGCGHSMLCLPLPTQTDLQGVLYVESSLADHAFAPEQIAILSTLASQAAASLENAELYAQAEKSRKRLSLLIDTIPILAWSARVDGYADYFNRRWLDYTGMTAEEALGWKWTSALHPDDAAGLRVTWERLLGAAEAGEAEARLRRADGEYRWFLFRAQPLFDAMGKVVEWYGTNTDIEERKLAELELGDRLRFWTLRSELATTFALAPADQLGARLDVALRRVGEFFDLDRVTIYGLPTTGDDATITHEWTKAGTSRQSLKVDALPFARAVATLQKGADVRIPTVEELPEHWSGEREQLKTLGVRSVVGLPMIIGGVTIALIGLACSSRKVDWSDDTLQQMHLLGEVSQMFLPANMPPLSWNTPRRR